MATQPYMSSTGMVNPPMEKDNTLSNEHTLNAMRMFGVMPHTSTANPWHAITSNNIAVIITAM